MKFDEIELCPRHGTRMHWLNESNRVCPGCRAERASEERIESARSTRHRFDEVHGFGWRPRKQEQIDIRGEFE